MALPLLLFLMLVLRTNGETALFTSGVTGGPSSTERTDATDVPLTEDPEAELKMFESLEDAVKLLEGDDPVEDAVGVHFNSNEQKAEASDVDDPLQQIRRQGDMNPKFGQRQTRPGVDFDDKNQNGDPFPPPIPYPPRMNTRARTQKAPDGAPVLQLTQGGYRRPYEASANQNSDESEPRPQVDTTNRGRVSPHVSYSAPPQMPLQRPFGVPPRGYANSNHILPTSVQNGFLNTPPAGFTDFTNFQAQFPTANDNGGYPRPLFHPSSRNVFQNPAALFHSSPQYTQVQPVVIDPSRVLQPQYLSGSYPAYSYDTVEDASRPDYAAYFRHPTPISPQYQVSPNFYGTSHNLGDGLFGHSPISLVLNNEGPAPFSPRFVRYQSAQDQQQPQEASHDKKEKEGEGEDPMKESLNKQDSTSVPFGARLQAHSNAPRQTEFYMRYPVREAGYGTQETLPTPNTPGDSPESASRPFPFLSGRDPYLNALNALQPPPRENRVENANRSDDSSFLRSVPFGYSPSFVSYPDRGPGSPLFQGGDGNAFQPPDGHFAFPSNQQRGEEDVDRTPACAQKNNASLCFEDADYPARDVLYSLNADAFLLERFTSPGEAFPEQNQTEENYVCQADIKYGAPLRARNAAGKWKVLVNMDKEFGRGRFTQPIRLEVCREEGEACSHTEGKVKTICVQKYILQTLLSWSRDRGVHNDLYRLPVACSCQLA